MPGLIFAAGCCIMMANGRPLVERNRVPMNKKDFKIMLVCVIASLLVSCAAAAPSRPTLTFQPDGCTYQGPTQLPPEFVLTYVVENSPHPGFIVLVVALAPGKTVGDLATLPAADPPPTWVNKLVYDVALQPGTYTKTVNLADIASYRGEPIYFACFFTDLPHAIGAVGPIDIKK